MPELGLAASLLALDAVTVAVKVTDWPEVEGFWATRPAMVVVESVYWAPPEYTKWYGKLSQASWLELLSISSMGTPGRLTVALAPTVADPEKVGNVK